MKSLKGLALIAVLVAIIAVASASTLKSHGSSLARKGFHVQKPASLADPTKPTWCGVCVDWMGNAVNQLINIILNVGIPGDCNALCQLYPGGSFDQALCEMYCDIKGINFFMNLLNNFNPDFIAICENLEVCPRTLNAKAKISALTVSPTTGNSQTTFTITIRFNVQAQLGTGMMIVQVNPPDAPPMQAVETLVSLPVGPYDYSFTLQANPSQDEPLDPGSYQVVGALCEGSCGGSGPYSYQLDQQQTTFTVTQ